MPAAMADYQGWRLWTMWNRIWQKRKWSERREGRQSTSSKLNASSNALPAASVALLLLLQVVLHGVFQPSLRLRYPEAARLPWIWGSGERDGDIHPTSEWRMSFAKTRWDAEKRCDGWRQNCRLLNWLSPNVYTQWVNHTADSELLTLLCTN